MGKVWGHGGRGSHSRHKKQHAPNGGQDYSTSFQYSRKPLNWDEYLIGDNLIDVLSCVWKVDCWRARMDTGISILYISEAEETRLNV